MKTFQTLLLREWMQNRLAWTLLALVPMGLVFLVLLSPWGTIQVDIDTVANNGGEAALPTLVALVAITATAFITFLIQWVASLFTISGLARRDHGDRSTEFWLSLPTSHSQSMAAPLLMHLVLVPAATLLVGLAGGYLMSLAAVGRVAGFAAWFSLPWGSLLPASLALTGRVLAGLPLATLWLMPLVLLVVLANALFRRWGVVVVGVAFGLGSLALKQWIGQPLLTDWLDKQLNGAGRALVFAEHFGDKARSASEGLEALAALPYWVLGDFASAVRALASPHFVIGLVLAAALFAALLQWRRRSG
jgi:ABC-2 type transport system permease protein